MDINRNNYESWFMDYLDGTLDAAGEEILMTFLEFNPDLKSELEGLRMVELEAGDIEYDLKASLRRPSDLTVKQDVLDDFEGFCISGIEDQLSPVEEILLKEIIDENPESAETYRLFASTILKADTSISFPGKSRLKRRFIQLPSARMRIAAIAASLILLLSLPFVFRNAVQDNGLPVAESTGEAIAPTNPVDSNPGQQPEEPLIETVNTDTGPDSRETETVSAPDGQESPLIVAEKESPVIVAVQESPALGTVSEFSTEKAAAPTMEPARVQVLLSKMEPIEASIGFEGIPASALAFRPGTRSTEDLLDDEGMDSPIDRPEIGRSLWRLADAGISRINRLSEEEYSLVRRTDDGGRTLRFTFETPIFGISAPMKSVNMP